MSLTRRHLLTTGGAVLAGGFLLPATEAAAQIPKTVRLMSDRLGERTWFDPIGLWVAPGTTVRFLNVSNVHTVSAYHPANGNRTLRIPERAKSFHSGHLVEPKSAFRHNFAVEGVYDYYCEPHEQAGMVGRIVVGRPGAGPGTRPFGYFRADPRTRHWKPVPPAAQKALPPLALIMRQRIVRRR